MYFGHLGEKPLACLEDLTSVRLRLEDPLEQRVAPLYKLNEKEKVSRGSEFISFGFLMVNAMEIVTSSACLHAFPSMVGWIHP